MQQLFLQFFFYRMRPGKWEERQTFLCDKIVAKKSIVQCQMYWSCTYTMRTDHSNKYWSGNEEIKTLGRGTFDTVETDFWTDLVQGGQLLSSEGWSSLSTLLSFFHPTQLARRLSLVAQHTCFWSSYSTAARLSPPRTVLSWSTWCRARSGRFSAKMK